MMICDGQKFGCENEAEYCFRDSDGYVMNVCADCRERLWTVYPNAVFKPLYTVNH